MRRIFAIFFNKEKNSHKFNENDKDMEKLKNIRFSYRQGFADRVTAKLENRLNEFPHWEMYNRLSAFLPRFSVACLSIVVLLGITLIFLNGGLDASSFLGTEKIDDSNFISYLIIQK